VVRGDEEGLDGGPVIPADYDGSTRGIATVKANVDRSGEIGQLVAQISDRACCSYRCWRTITKPANAGLRGTFESAGGNPIQISNARSVIHVVDLRKFDWRSDRRSARNTPVLRSRSTHHGSDLFNYTRCLRRRYSWSALAGRRRVALDWSLYQHGEPPSVSVSVTAVSQA